MTTPNQNVDADLFLLQANRVAIEANVADQLAPSLSAANRRIFRGLHIGDRDTVW